MIAVYSNFGDVYISDICIARHVTAHVTLSRDGSSFQGLLLLLFSRSSLPACARGSGAQKESRWEWQRSGCVQHAEGATLQDGVRDLTAGQREARLEVNAAGWRKATGLGDGRAASVHA